MYVYDLYYLLSVYFLFFPSSLISFSLFFLNKIYIGFEFVRVHI